MGDSGLYAEFKLWAFLVILVKHIDLSWPKIDSGFSIT